MKVLNPILFIVLQLFIIDTYVFCFFRNPVDDVEDKSLAPYAISPEEFKTELKDEEITIIDPHSFLYDKSKKKMMKEFELETKSSTAGLEDILKCEDQGIMFYKRLVNLLIMNMSTWKDGEMIKGTINIEALPSQLEILNNCLDDKVSIRELDSVLGDIIRKSHTDYYTRTLIYLDSFLRIIKEHEKSIYILQFVCIVLILMRKIRRWTMKTMFVVSLLCIFVLSFFITWWQLIKQAEIKLMVAQAKFKDMPRSCDPSRMNMWDKFLTTISSSEECEQYFRSMEINPMLEVTPALALSHMVSATVLHPAECIGDAINIFVNKITGDMYWWTALPVKYLFITICAIFVPLIIFILSGGSIKLGIGPFFHFALSGKNDEPSRGRQRIEELHHRTDVIKEKEENPDIRSRNEQAISFDNTKKLNDTSPDENTKNKIINSSLNETKQTVKDRCDFAGGDTLMTNPPSSNDDAKKEA